MNVSQIRNPISPKDSEESSTGEFPAESSDPVSFSSISAAARRNEIDNYGGTCCSRFFVGVNLLSDQIWWGAGIWQHEWSSFIFYSRFKSKKLNDLKWRPQSRS
jgi:hypothetical protein